MVETLRLGDHCDKIGSGATPRGGKEVYLNDGPVSLIRSQNIRNDRFSYGGLAFISHEQAAQLQNVEVKEGDVLLNITGDSVARACQVDRAVLPARVNQHVAIIRPKPALIDAKFLRYFLVTNSMQAHMLGLAAAGATRNALTKAMIEDFRVPDWSIQKQRTISSLLGALDDKIELNRRMNETLGAMARAIFKDWFIDFGPTQAKMANRPAYLAPDLWLLFPDQLDHEGKPEGWERIPLREAADISSGGTPAKDQTDYWNGNIPWISPKAMNDMHVSDSEDRVTLAAVGNGTRIAPSGSVLVMVRGMGLHQGVRISQARKDVTFNQDVKALTPKRLSGTQLLFGLLDAAPYLFSRVEASGHGTGKLPTDLLDGLDFVSPNDPSRSILVRTLDVINDKIAANHSESNTLAALRDLLLPKLMSGEAYIEDDEHILGAST
jgi:type I restriction enzyme, S subunit